MSATYNHNQYRPTHDHRRRTPTTRAERAAFFEPRDHWLKWLAAELATDYAQRLARETDVSPNTARALAVVIGNSGPSFAKEGIFAKQETLATELAKNLVRTKTAVRQVRRGLALLVKIGALRVEARSGHTNLMVPLLAGTRLYDNSENTSGFRTAASATPDANVRPTPDASVRGPRTPASYESSYLSPRIDNLHTSSLPYPPLGERRGSGPTAFEFDGSWSDTDYQQQATPSKVSGCPNRGEPEDSCQTPEQATEPICVGEILPPENAPNFERFWNDCSEPRGKSGFAISEWSKLSPEEQRRACERPSNGGAFAGTWLRNRMFNLAPSSIVEHREYGLAAYAARRARRADDAGSKPRMERIFGEHH